jgi:hypothetical protein
VGDPRALGESWHRTWFHGLSRAGQSCLRPALPWGPTHLLTAAAPLPGGRRALACSSALLGFPRTRGEGSSRAWRGVALVASFASACPQLPRPGCYRASSEVVGVFGASSSLRQSAWKLQPPLASKSTSRTFLFPASPEDFVSGKRRLSRTHPH